MRAAYLKRMGKNHTSRILNVSEIFEIIFFESYSFDRAIKFKLHD